MIGNEQSSELHNLTDRALEVARADWLDAAVEYSQSAARIHRIIQGGQRPTPEDLARSEDAMAALEAARLRYVELSE